MTIEEKCRLSYYEKVTALNEKHGVWLVKHKENGEICVMKELTIYNVQVYEMMKQWNSRYFPRIYDYFMTDEKKLILIEEYISGRTLANLIKQDGLYSDENVADILQELCRGLQWIHHASPQIVHRDIKLENVMVTNDGNIKIIDFNAAKIFDDGKMQDTILIGTEGFAAPEQYGFGQSDARTDIYAVGVLLNYMLTGKNPKEELATGIYRELILKCTKLDPEMRYQSVDEILQDVNRYVISQNKNQGAQKASWKGFVIPGFRSVTLWKMALALLGYSAIAAFSVSLTITEKDGSPTDTAELVFMKCTFFVMCMAAVFLASNYRGIQKHFLFADHKNSWVRTIAVALWCVIVMFFILVLGVILSEMLAAFS